MAKGGTARRLERPPGRPGDVVEVGAARTVSDADLVRRARDEGDRWAEEALFRRHAGAVAATVMRLLGNRAEAEDVVQDTFVTALGKLDTLREPEAVRSWLLTIAVRRVQQRFRRRRLCRALGLERDREADDEVSCARFVAEEASPEMRAELRLLDGALAALPAKQRIAWMLRHVEGCSLEETARACDCSLATIKRRIAAVDASVRQHARIEEDDHG